MGECEPKPPRSTSLHEFSLQPSKVQYQVLAGCGSPGPSADRQQEQKLVKLWGKVWLSPLKLNVASDAAALLREGFSRGKAWKPSRTKCIVCS